MPEGIVIPFLYAYDSTPSVYSRERQEYVLLPPYSTVIVIMRLLPLVRVGVSWKKKLSSANDDDDSYDAGNPGMKKEEHLRFPLPA